MDVSFSEEQKMIMREARKLLAKKMSPNKVREVMKTEKGYSVELWSEMAELGWLGLMVPQEYGGLGASFSDQLVLLGEMGRACTPGPHFSNLAGTIAVMEGGSHKQKMEILPQVIKGESILTIAFDEFQMRGNIDFVECRAERADGCYSIYGKKMFVEHAHVADYIIVLAKKGNSKTVGDDMGLFIVGANEAGVSITPLDAIGSGKQYAVTLSDVKCREDRLVGDSWLDESMFRGLLVKIGLAKAGEMLGGAERACELAVNYVKIREQFGAPIGSYQIIQSYCADMLIGLEALRWLIHYAGWKISEKMSYLQEAAAAKLWADKVRVLINNLALQAHGAIGFTEEYELALHWLGGDSGQLWNGSQSYLGEMVAHELGM